MDSVSAIEVANRLLLFPPSCVSRTVAAEKSKSCSEVEQLWSEAGVRTPADFRDRGYISGVRYLDQAEDFALDSCVEDTAQREPGLLFSFARSISRSVGDFGRATRGDKDTTSITQAPKGVSIQSPQDADKADFNLDNEFVLQPRRSLTKNPDAVSDSVSSGNNSNLSSSAAKTVRVGERKAVNFLVGGLYLRKMRRGSNILKGLHLQETSRGPRIAVINAVGGISSGASSSNGLGSDTLVKLLQEASSSILSCLFRSTWF